MLRVIVLTLLIGYGLIEPAVQAAERRLPKPVIVIDAGHGGHDPGSLSILKGRCEKEVTLAIALLVREKLDGSQQMRVVLTRHDDRFVSLARRQRRAEQLNADLFISIHADSAPDQRARGASAYTLSDDGLAIVRGRLKDGRGARVAGQRLDPDAAFILGDLRQNVAMNGAASFASALERAFGSNIAMRRNFHLSADFAVLKAIGVPAVLVEAGYVTNADDAARLFSVSGQRQLATSIVSAINHYFEFSYSSAESQMLAPINTGK